MEIKTIKIKNKDIEIENNTEKSQLIIKKGSEETKYNFSIIDVTGNIVTFKEKNCIYQTGTHDPRIKDIIPLLLNPPKQRKPRKRKQKKVEK